jgi:hypothetical protein
VRIGDAIGRVQADGNGNLAGPQVNRLRDDSAHSTEEPIAVFEQFNLNVSDSNFRLGHISDL